MPNLAKGDGPAGEHRLQTTAVANFPANGWGLYDMHGNVREWCADHWHDTYEGPPEDERPWIDETPGQYHAKRLRGGSWDHFPWGCRSDYRVISHPDYRLNHVGFRVCCLHQDLLLYP
jgi:formylglycine-generating enzyme required for sulfatase activity